MPRSINKRLTYLVFVAKENDFWEPLRRNLLLLHQTQQEEEHQRIQEIQQQREEIQRILQEIHQRRIQQQEEEHRRRIQRYHLMFRRILIENGNDDDLEGLDLIAYAYIDDWSEAHPVLTTEEDVEEWRAMLDAYEEINERLNRQRRMETMRYIQRIRQEEEQRQIRIQEALQMSQMPSQQERRIPQQEEEEELDLELMTFEEVLRREEVSESE